MGRAQRAQHAHLLQPRVQPGRKGASNARPGARRQRQAHGANQAQQIGAFAAPEEGLYRRGVVSLPGERGIERLQGLRRLAAQGVQAFPQNGRERSGPRQREHAVRLGRGTGGEGFGGE